MKGRIAKLIRRHQKRWGEGVPEPTVTTEEEQARQEVKDWLRDRPEEDWGDDEELEKEFF